MADIVLSVDFSSLTQAEKKLSALREATRGFSVSNLTAGLSGLESRIKSLVDAQAKGKISHQTYILGLLEIKRAYEQLGHSSQKAASDVLRLAAEFQNQTAARAAAAAAAELARAQAEAARQAAALAARQRELRVQFQDGYALFAKQRQAMRDLREAYRSNIITLDQYKAKLQEIRALSLHQNQAGLQANQRGVFVQQLGYQVGDFAVQLSSGTHVMVAFSQQATQLAGVLPLLAGSFGISSAAAIGLSAALGVIIPVVAGIAYAIMRSSGATKTLEQRFSDLSDAGNNLKDTFDLLQNESLDETYGNLSTKVRKLAESFISLDNAGELKALLATIEKLKSVSEAPWWKELMVGAAAGVGASWVNFPTREQLDESEFKKTGFAMGKTAYDQFIMGMEAAAIAGDREDVLEIFQKLVDDATDLGSSSDQVTLSGITLLNQLKAAMLQLAESSAILNGSAKAAKDLEASVKEASADAEQREKDRVAAVQGRSAAQEALVAKLQEEKQLQANLLEMQGDLAGAMQIRKALAYEAAYADVMAQATTAAQRRELEGVAQAAGESAVRALDLGQQLSSSKQEAKDLAGALKDAAAALSSLVSFGAGLDKALAVATAKVAALKNNAEAGVAGQIAGMRFDLNQEVKEALASGVDPWVVNAMRERNSATISALEASLNQEQRLLDSQREAKKAAKGASKEDPMEKLLEQIARQKELVGLSAKEAALKQEIWRVEDALGKDRAKYSAAQIQAIAQQNLAIKEQLKVQEESHRQMQSFADVLKTSMSDAFMSMVDGTASVKDAFKNMAAAIIKHLFEVLVVQRLVGSWDNSTGVGSGIVGAIMGSLKVPVDTTTTKASPYVPPTKMPSETTIAPRLVDSWDGSADVGNGIVGAIMEGLKAPVAPTVTKAPTYMSSTKMSSGTTVVQNFNLAANGDESVKRIIKEEAPKLAKQAQAAVLDARRRGGAYGKAF